MSRLLAEFISGLDQRFPDDSSQMTMSEWLTRNTKLRNRPFSFKGYEFQKQIADDMHPDLSCIKLSQIGLSEIQFRKFFGFLKRNVGTAGIFSMPNQPMRDRISVTRIKTMIESDPIFNGPMVDKPVRRKDLYQVDQSFGYITGATEGEATSISADVHFSDEVDLADQSMLALFGSRLQGSKWKIRQRFSTPTYYGYGIDAAYNISDQHEYFYRCPSCNHWQIPTFEPRFVCLPGLTKDVEDLSKLTSEDIDLIDFEACHVRCEKCSKPVDLTDPSLREWNALFPARKSRGYRVRCFSVANITIPYILGQLKEYQRADNMKGWHNTVIGEAYNDANARISEEDIRHCMKGPGAPDPYPYGGLFIGIDAGLTCHVTIGTPDHIFEWHQVPQGELVEFVKGRLNTMRIVGGAMDMFPYTNLAEEIRDIEGHQGKIMPIQYATVPTAAALVEKKDEFDNITHYVANRTKAIDVVSKATRNRIWSFTGYGEQQTLIITHMRDMIRVEQADTPPQWQKINGNDHYLHSLGYLQLGVRVKAAQDYNSGADQRSSVLLMGGEVLNGRNDNLHKGADTLGVLG
jgi:hypothetical protein